MKRFPPFLRIAAPLIIGAVLLYAAFIVLRIALVVFAVAAAVRLISRAGWHRRHMSGHPDFRLGSPASHAIQLPRRITAQHIAID